MNKSMQSLVRSIDEATVDVVRVELGVIAVPDQVELESASTKETPNLGTTYQGVIEINHVDKVADQTDNSSESTEEQKPIGRQVHNHYIEEPPKPTLKELENLYPNESPLLAPN